MNKFICFALVFFAAIVSGNCGGYRYAPAGYAAPVAAYNSPSYALGSGHHGDHFAYPAAHYGAPAKYGLKYSAQPAFATELNPGQYNYKAYNSAPTYSQVALPLSPSVPVAKLFGTAKHSYGAAPHYGHSASY